MNRFLWAISAVALAGSLEAAGIIAAAASTGEVIVLDKSKPTRTIITLRPYGLPSGLYVAAGDVNGDGSDDIVSGPPAGAGQDVKVFNQNGGVLQSLSPYGSSFNGGVRVAVGDVNGDAALDIITSAGSSASPTAPGGHVKVFDGRTGVELRSFAAYENGFLGGVYVAAGDVTGDGIADIITGAGAGGGPHVKVFDGRTGAEVRSFLAYDPAFIGGVRVGAADLDLDGKADVITAPGAGMGPHVKVFSGATGNLHRGFLAFDPGFTGGVYVAGGSVVATPGAPSGGIATIRVFEDDGTVQWLMPFPGYTGGLTIATSAGAMSGTPARPRIPGAK